MADRYIPGDNAFPLWPAEHSQVRDLPADQHPTVTPYLPAGEGPFPTIVVFPGGGYGMKAAHEGGAIAEWLNAIGVAAFVVDYRVAPHRHPAPLDDAQRAIRRLRAEASTWNIRPDRIGVIGFSAGGHLAATTATRWDQGDAAADDPIARASSRPDVAILSYPVISWLYKPHQGSFVNLLGDHPDPDLAQGLSAETQVTSETPPTFLWHTAEDAGVDVAHSLRFANALAEHSVTFGLHVFPFGRHGLGLAPELPNVAIWTELAANFLDDIGFLAD